MGKVIDGTYDFSLARWFYTVERQKILDFVSIGKDKSVLALHQDSLRTLQLMVPVGVHGLRDPACFVLWPSAAEDATAA